MRKNYLQAFKIDRELAEKINSTLEKINQDSQIHISKSDFIRTAIERACDDLKNGTLESITFLYRTHTK